MTQKDAFSIWNPVVTEELELYVRGRRKAVSERIRNELPSLDPKERHEHERDLKQWFAEDAHSFGISLSGGGIRSATISLGFLQVLNEFRVLEKADYLSTVSGGGYLGSYVHAKLRQEREAPNPFENLFEQKDIDRLKEHRRYLAPGSPRSRRWTTLRLFAAFSVSTLMNAVWILLLVATTWFAARTLTELPWPDAIGNLVTVVTWGILLLLTWHFFFHVMRHRWRGIWSSDRLYGLEALLLAIIVIALLLQAISSEIAGGSGLENLIWQSVLAALELVGIEIEPTPATTLWPQSLLAFLISGIGFVVIGFFADPNVLTMHRYYRDRVATAFLGTVSPEATNLRLGQLAPDDSDKAPQAPYPLINTCLNLCTEADQRARGMLSSDYFLLSPLRCGSVVLGDYADGRKEPYSQMPLATAVAASGAAVSPAMGSSTGRIRAFLMTLLNIRLGYWVHNPRHIDDSFKRGMTWWPWYHLQELLAKAGTGRQRVNISDGGHIENLGVFELLRRRCRLIIALDAGADPRFRFADLENLVRRAREQLGLRIDFGNLKPEDLIRPSPSFAYSRTHFVVARISPIEGSRLKNSYPEDALLIYVKSSQRPINRLRIGEDIQSHDYKRHHPAFPHETTANQFFDEIQWEAYYKLGRYIAGDLLGREVRNEATGISLSLQGLFEELSSIHSADDLAKRLKRQEESA